MADTKITALTAITTVDPAVDVLPIVDVSDTTMAASGTTKKITSNQILGAGGTATLASATITGDLTVDTSTLKVDSTNNRVGIGTASPTDTLDVNGRVTALRYLSSSSNAALPSFAVSAGNGAYNSGTNEIGFSINSTSAMTLNSTGLGVGTSPASKLTVSDAAAYPIRVVATAGTTAGIEFQDPTTGATRPNIASRGAALTIETGGSERLRIDSSGNVGIGVTPSAWNSSYRGLQLGAGGAISAHTSASLPWLVATSNSFINSAGDWKFINNGYSTRYLARGDDGTQSWWTSNNGLAGGTVAYTQAMTLDASGNLLVGTTSLNGSWNTKLTLSNDSGTTKWAVGPYLGGVTNFLISAGASAGVYLNGTAATSWTSASDERLKDIIEPISNAIAKVGSLRAVIGKFKFDENNTRKPFLIAQDVQSVLPEAVDASNPDKLGVAYTDVIPLLVAAIKELTARVQTLETR